jgi:histidine triad (HIT) family protein
MQEIFYVHFHVFPRFRGDGFGLKFSPEYHTRRPERPELDELAATLASRMFPSALLSDSAPEPK